MANANAETGYKSKAFRGASQIEHVQSFELPQPTTNSIPMPELEQTNNVVPKIGGSTELGAATITCVQDKDATVQNAMVDTFYSGDKTPEAFSLLDCNSSTGATEVTYSFSGYISSAKPGPFETGAGKLVVFNIELTSAVTIVRA